MRKNQTTRTTLAPSSPSSPSLPSSPLSLSSPSSSSPQKSPTSSPRKNKPMLGLGFGGVPYRASIPICELKVPNEREKRDVGGSVTGGGGAGFENDKTGVSLNSSSSSNNNQEPDTPSTNSPQTPTDISEPFSYHRDLGSGKRTTRTGAAAFDSAATMRNLNLKNSDNNKNNTDEFEEDDHNENDHKNNTNNNNNNNDHHHDNNPNPNPSLFNPSQIPKPTFQDLEEPYGGTKHFMMAHGLKCKFTLPSYSIYSISSLIHSYMLLMRFLGYDSTDCAIREEILGQLRDMEWQNRVNDAREEFVRMEGNGR